MKKAKIQVSEIFAVLIFVVDESVTHALALAVWLKAKSECLELSTERDGNLSPSSIMA